MNILTRPRCLTLLSRCALPLTNPPPLYLRAPAFYFSTQPDKPDGTNKFSDKHDAFKKKTEEMMKSTPEIEEDQSSYTKS